METLRASLAIYISMQFAMVIRNNSIYRYPFGKIYIYFFACLLIYILISLSVTSVIEDGLSIPFYLVLCILLGAFLLPYLYIKIRNSNYEKYHNIKK